MIKVLSVERTGNEGYISSSEYVVFLSNGKKRFIWSPPWHELSPVEEDKIALEKAIELFEEKP